MELKAAAKVSEAKLYVGEDMSEAAEIDSGPGLAVVYSSRQPGKASPNEDVAGVFPLDASGCVLAVADGLGGARAGDRASHAAVVALGEALEGGIEEGRDLRESILDGFEGANGAVLDLGIGAATTLAVVEVKERTVRSYHAGDSLILVVGQRGKVKMHSVPHSPVGYGVESGLLDAEEAMYHEERHIVSNVVGIPDMRIDLGPALDLATRDTVLLASDGLWDNLHTEEIVEIIRKGALRKASRRLVALSHERMRNKAEDTPSKPDDLTFILFRLQRRKGERG